MLFSQSTQPAEMLEFNFYDSGIQQGASVTILWTDALGTDSERVYDDGSLVVALQDGEQKVEIKLVLAVKSAFAFVLRAYTEMGSETSEIEAADLEKLKCFVYDRRRLVYELLAENSEKEGQIASCWLNGTVRRSALVSGENYTVRVVDGTGQFTTAESAFTFFYNGSAGVTLTSMVSLALEIVDALTKKPLLGARCAIFSSTYTSDAAGRVWVSSAQDAQFKPKTEIKITVKMSGYADKTLYQTLVSGKNVISVYLDQDSLSCVEVELLDQRDPETFVDALVSLNGTNSIVSATIRSDMRELCVPELLWA